MSEIGDRFGHGFCDITTRQTIQYHWLRIEDIPAIFAELDSVGMTTSGACGDITRNVVGCPVAGIDPNEIIDGSEKLREVSAMLTDNKRVLEPSAQIQDQRLSGCCIHCAQPDINCRRLFRRRTPDQRGRKSAATA